MTVLWGARLGRATRRSTIGRTPGPVARRDVAFWQRLAAAQTGPRPRARVRHGPHCAAGRASPAARLVGIDRSEAMLARARKQAAARPAGRSRPSSSAATSARLPFRAPSGFGLRDGAVRHAPVAHPRARSAGDPRVRSPRVLRRGGVFGIDLVPDLPRWAEYNGGSACAGSRDAQRHADAHRIGPPGPRRAGLTIFDQEYVERRGPGRRVHRFALTFRTLSVPQMSRRLERAGFRIDAVLGDYQGGPLGPARGHLGDAARKSYSRDSNRRSEGQKGQELICRALAIRVHPGGGDQPWWADLSRTEEQAEGQQPGATRT